MNELMRAFQKTLNNIGLGGNEPLNPVFYNSPVSIRFEIGVNTGECADCESLEYINKAYCRAKTIYESLPERPTILRIDVYPDCAGDCEQDFESLKLPCPHEKIDSKYSDEDGDIIHRISFYWNLKVFDFDYKKLLYEVIKSELSGMSFLTSNVFFADTKNDVLFHLYDDRGADVSASSAETIRSLYENLNGFILDYDRTRIDSIFEIKA